MKQRGFSLIELMAATLITSIVVIAAYTLITNSTNSFKDEDERRILESNLRNAELILQRDLSRIGYHIHMDDENSNDAANIRAIRTWIKTENPVAPDTVTRRFSEFSMIADLTDFEDGFLINSSIDGGSTITISFEQSLQIPLTAHEVATVNEVAPTHQQATNNSFKSAFQKAFTYASAVFITAPSGTSVLFPITSKTEINDYKLEISKANLSNNLLFGYSPITGLKDLAAYPVVVITYRIIKNSGKYSLQRCYNNSMSQPTEDNINVSTCNTLINNLEYFELLPFGENLNYITQSNGVIFQPHNSNNILNSTVQTMKINQLRGFYYMIGATGNRISQSAHTENANIVQPKFSNNKPFEHIQGIAMLKTPNDASSDNQHTIHNNN